ncbi:hypothetical protein EON81_13615 [bacterium]|nr:MAG: hypothetical protein EON81_13615 [bacterium]
MTDRVARYMGGGRVEIVAEPQVDLPPGGLIVRTEASGLCSGELMAWYMDKKVPHVLGHEVAGIVERSDDDRFPVGSRVFPHHHAPCLKCDECARGAYVHCPQWRSTKLRPGGMADRFAVPAENLNDTLRVDDLRPIDAALIEPLACVVKAFRQGGVAWTPTSKGMSGRPRPDFGINGISGETVKRQGAYLPHWTQDGGAYHVVFRLADSIPKSLAEEWHVEREAFDRGQALSPAEKARYRYLHTERVQRALLESHGACALRSPEAAFKVVELLRNRDGIDYDLVAYAVMPNHVHVLVKPRKERNLADMVQAWKSVSARRINALVGKQGELWQSEYYDHLIRDESDLHRVIDYIKSNPGRSAGLDDVPVYVVDSGVGPSEPRAGAPGDTLGRGAQATSVAVIGLGFMGLLHMFLAPGARGYDLNPLRREWAANQGLDAVHPDEAMPAETVFVCPGSQGAFDLAMKMVKPQGTIVMFAPLPPGEDLRVPQEAYFKDITIASAYSCGPDDTAIAAELLRAGIVRAEQVVERFVELEELPSSYVDMRDGKILKAMVVWPES